MVPSDDELRVMMRLTSCLARIDQVEPLVGAFITRTSDQAREHAQAAEHEIMRGNYRGPLHGIPYAVKDTHYTAGILTTARTGYLADLVPDWDATVVARLNNAGEVLLGKTNLPEYSFGTPTGVPLGTSNPWDLTRSRAFQAPDPRPHWRPGCCPWPPAVIRQPRSAARPGPAAWSVSSPPTDGSAATAWPPSAGAWTTLAA